MQRYCSEVIFWPDINLLRASAGCNVRYGRYRGAKGILNVVQTGNEDRIQYELKLQEFIISSILLHASSSIQRTSKILHGAFSLTLQNAVSSCKSYQEVVDKPGIIT